MQTKPWKNEHVYKAFDDLIILSESAIADKQIQYKGIDDKDLRERIIQRIVQIIFYPYCKECTTRAKKEAYPFPSKEETLLLDGVFINCSSGNIQLTAKTIFKYCIDYFFEWIKTIISLIVGFVTANKKYSKPCTWIFGLGFSDVTAGGSEKAFDNFCKNGPVVPLQNANKLIIQETALHQSNIDWIVYAKNPIQYQLKKCRLGFLNRLQLLLRCAVNPISFFLAVAKQPLMAVLSKDLIQQVVVQLLDQKKKIQSVLITNSNFFQQPLWMRGSGKRSFRVHELHYGQNAIPFLYKDVQVKGLFPPFRHVRVDEHWVWTEGFKQFLSESGHTGPIHAAGPIVWYLPENKTVNPVTDLITIAVFDVAPIYQSVADQMGIIHYYYTADKLIRFIDSIINVCDELSGEMDQKISIKLKSKRHFTEGLHDKKYIDYVNTIHEKHHNVEVADSRSNIFSLLKSCDLSISIPYTTVPYVATWLQKPAAYFDPLGELIFTNEPSPYLHNVSDKHELKELIRNIILTTTQKK